jgi:sulfatase maturation enzyme AslB (radical SAM superfamily)
MIMYDLILCIGSGSSRSDLQAKKIANNYKLSYHAVLEQETKIKKGVYHTSIYDVKLQALSEKLKNYKIKIVVLDMLVSEFKATQDFADTMSLINDLYRSLDIKPENENNIFYEIEKNKSFCVMPFFGIYQDQYGGSHCCNMPLIWNQTPKFFDSKSNNIRSSILAGEKVTECKKCYDLESNGAISDRISWSYYSLSELGLKSKDDLLTTPNVKIYHAVLDNQCNLQCRMCDPYSSNLIAKEYQLLKLHSTIPTKNNNTLPSIENLATLQKLTVTGGEPTVNSKFLDFLTQVSNSNHKNLSILINSNVVILNRQLKRLIDSLSNLKFGVSIDGIDQVNQYIRWPSPWSKIKENIKYLHDTNRLSHFKTTVSLYNIQELYELFQWIDCNYPDIPISMNFVETPEQLTPWNLPDTSVAVNNLLKSKRLSIYHRNENFRKYISYMEEKLATRVFDYELFKKFFGFNDLLDASRKISLKDYIASLEVYRSVLPE